MLLFVRLLLFSTEPNQNIGKTQYKTKQKQQNEKTKLKTILLLSSCCSYCCRFCLLLFLMLFWTKPTNLNKHMKNICNYHTKSNQPTKTTKTTFIYILLLLFIRLFLFILLAPKLQKRIHNNKSNFRAIIFWLQSCKNIL